MLKTEKAESVTSLTSNIKTKMLFILYEVYVAPSSVIICISCPKTKIDLHLSILPFNFHITLDTALWYV